MAKQPKIVVAGHLCMDLTPIFPLDADLTLEKVFCPGVLTHTQGIEIHIGGAVANTGITLSKFGAEATLVGKIGEDSLGTLLQETLSQYPKAKQEIVVSPEDRTSHTIALSLPGYERIFLHDAGANATFASADLSFETLPAKGHFHFGYPPLMESIWENDGDELRQMLEQAKAMGMSTSLDMAAVDAQSAAGQINWGDWLTNVLPLVDIFAPSIDEIAYMLYPEITFTSESLLEHIGEFSGILQEMGPSVVLLKCGRPGMYLHTAETMDFLNQRESNEGWESVRRFEETFATPTVASTTGAGDVSIAAFLYGFLTDRTPAEAMQLATAAGAACVEAYDSLSGIADLESLEKRIRSGWSKESLESLPGFVFDDSRNAWFPQ